MNKKKVIPLLALSATMILSAGAALYTGVNVAKNNTYHIAAAEEEVALTGMNVSLGENILFNVYVGEGVASVRFTMEEASEEVEVEAGVAVFKGVAPHRIATPFTVEALNESGVVMGEGQEVSVKAYLQNLLALDFQSSGCTTKLQYDAMRTLAVDILNYGAAAQTYKGEAEGLANADLTAEQRSLASEILDEDIENGAAVLTGEVAWGGAGVRFDSKLGLYFVFGADSATQYTAKINGETLPVGTYAEGLYIVRYNGFNATDMNKDVVLQLYEGEDLAGTCTYSIKTYLCKMSESAIHDLTLATYLYGKGAVAYSVYGDLAKLSFTENQTDGKVVSLTVAMKNSLGYSYTDKTSEAFAIYGDSARYALLDGKTSYTLTDGTLSTLKAENTDVTTSVASITNADVSVHSLRATAPLTISGGTFTVSVSDAEKDGIIMEAAGQDALTITGGAVVSLSNTSETTGKSAINIKEGCLVVDNATVQTNGFWYGLYTSGDVSVQNGATLTFGTNSTACRNVGIGSYGNPTLTVESGTTVNVYAKKAIDLGLTNGKIGNVIVNGTLNAVSAGDEVGANGYGINNSVICNAFTVGAEGQVLLTTNNADNMDANSVSVAGTLQVQSNTNFHTGVKATTVNVAEGGTLKVKDGISSIYNYLIGSWEAGATIVNNGTIQGVSSDVAKLVRLYSGTITLNGTTTVDCIGDSAQPAVSAVELAAGSTTTVKRTENITTFTSRGTLDVSEALKATDFKNYGTTTVVRESEGTAVNVPSRLDVFGGSLVATAAEGSAALVAGVFNASAGTAKFNGTFIVKDGGDWVKVGNATLTVNGTMNIAGAVDYHRLWIVDGGEVIVNNTADSVAIATTYLQVDGGSLTVESAGDSLNADKALFQGGVSDFHGRVKIATTSTGGLFRVDGASASVNINGQLKVYGDTSANRLYVRQGALTVSADSNTVMAAKIEVGNSDKTVSGSLTVNAAVGDALTLDGTEQYGGDYDFYSGTVVLNGTTGDEAAGTAICMNKTGTSLVDVHSACVLTVNNNFGYAIGSWGGPVNIGVSGTLNLGTGKFSRTHFYFNRAGYIQPRNDTDTTDKAVLNYAGTGSLGEVLAYNSLNIEGAISVGDISFPNRATNEATQNTLTVRAGGGNTVQTGNINAQIIKVQSGNVTVSGNITLDGIFNYGQFMQTEKTSVITVSGTLSVLGDNTDEKRCNIQGTMTLGAFSAQRMVVNTTGQLTVDGNFTVGSSTNSGRFAVYEGGTATVNGTMTVYGNNGSDERCKVQGTLNIIQETSGEIGLRATNIYVDTTGELNITVNKKNAIHYEGLNQGGGKFTFNGTVNLTNTNKSTEIAIWISTGSASSITVDGGTVNVDGFESIMGCWNNENRFSVALSNQGEIVATNCTNGCVGLGTIDGDDTCISWNNGYNWTVDGAKQGKNDRWFTIQH